VTERNVESYTNRSKMTCCKNISRANRIYVSEAVTVCRKEVRGFYSAHENSNFSNNDEILSLTLKCVHPFLPYT